MLAWFIRSTKVSISNTFAYFNIQKLAYMMLKVSVTWVKIAILQYTEVRCANFSTPNKPTYKPMLTQIEVGHQQAQYEVKRLNLAMQLQEQF